ncbi:MAG: DUF6923 family protein [Nannocystaceae bacterium]
MKHTFKSPKLSATSTPRARWVYRYGSLFALSFAIAHLGGCASTCFDDGFGWQQDEACAVTASATETETDTDSNTNTVSDTETTEGPTDSDTTPTAGTMTMGETLNTTMTVTDTDGNGTSYCVDADNDGFGDPDNCTNVPDGDPPPPGTVPNDPNDTSDDDCDDSSPETFPGSAENDSETLCMKDLDGDGYGDDDPPMGVEPGTDCDDDDSDTHPGIDPDNPESCQVDKDMDGQGDQNPPPGVDPGKDCDDNDPYTFTGAAPNDDAALCMTDVDGDDWGDDTPSNPNASAGSDCDDSDPETYVGSAELEDATACMKDSDDDGWGDTNVPDGVDVGSDCYDSSPQFNPDTTTLMSMFDGISGDVQEVNIGSGELTAFASVNTEGLGSWGPSSAALDPVSGMFFATSNSDFRLYTVDYCTDDPPTPLNAHGKLLCGISFSNDGKLYGVDSEIDQLLEFDPDTGDLLNSTDITVDGAFFNVGNCGLTFDCVEGTVLMSDSNAGMVLRLDVETGEATPVATIADEQFGRSLAFDPMSKQVHSASGVSSLTIDLTGNNEFVKNADLMSTVNDLEYGPVCN